MNIWVILIEGIIMAMYFTITIFDLCRKYKNHPAWIYNYPKDIQDEYFKTHERVDVSLKSPKVFLIKMAALLLIALLILAMAYIAGAKSFCDGFIFAFCMMLWIGIYDTFFLDWTLFSNMKFFRLEGTEHMDAAYHQKWFHLKGMLFPGIIFAIIASLLVGWLIAIVQ